MQIKTVCQKQECGLIVLPRSRKNTGKEAEHIYEPPENKIPISCPIV
jgi:hypothetical protein